MTVVGWELAPPGRRYAVLAVVSVLLLAVVAPVGLGLALAAALALWLAAGGAGPWPLRLAGGGLVATLIATKYLPAWLGPPPGLAGVVVPTGLSYLVLRGLHFAVERRREGLARPPLADFVAWLVAFPTFTAGPIDRLDTVVRPDPPTATAHDRVVAAHLILTGLVKKFVLADVVLGQILAPATTHAVVANPGRLGVDEIWAYLFVSFGVAWLDFAGYSDLAAGSCRALGIVVTRNFDWPILARDPGDFWRRWHVSLAAWTQAYVYLPVLAATRRPYLAIYATFSVIGVWHAASLNWVCWGLWHATGVAVAAAWSRFKRARGIDLSGPLGQAPGRVATIAWVVAAQAFTAIDGQGGVWDAIRVLGRCVGLTLPASPW